MKQFITIFLLFLVYFGHAQEKDHLSLFTDREVYTSGETVLFQVFTPNGEESVVLQLSLINTQGKIINRVSRKIQNGQANGFVYLPDSLKTDTYLLCSSTPANQEIIVKELFVCNRFTGLTGIANTLRARETESAIEYPAENIHIEGINKEYHTRQNITLTANLSSEMLESAGNNLFVSVSEANQGFNSKTFLRANVHQFQKTGMQEEVVIDGFASNPENGTPFKNADILLTVPDSIAWINYVKSDSKGHFHFQLKNYYGKIPLVVQGVDAEKKQLVKIQLDKIDTIPSALPSMEYLPVPVEIQKKFDIAMDATTLRKIFGMREIDLKEQSYTKKHDYSFYGVPTEIVRPSQFLDLPDFTEISRELLPGVKFRAFNRIPTLQILNPVTLNYFNDPPLVTLDGVPVHDLNIIKNMGSKDIERIEICRKERYYGDLTFPGVVAIYATKPDLKRLGESIDLIKSEIETIQPDASVSFNESQKPNEPDLRRVFLWNPNLKMADKVKIEFTTSDLKGEYQLVMRLKSKDGKILTKIEHFEVK